MWDKQSFYFVTKFEFNVNDTSGKAWDAYVKQVAAHADVSVQTVSNALNAPHRLRPDTLERVTRSTERLLVDGRPVAVDALVEVTG